MASDRKRTTDNTSSKTHFNTRSGKCHTKPESRKQNIIQSYPQDRQAVISPSLYKGRRTTTEFEEGEGESHLSMGVA